MLPFALPSLLARLRPERRRAPRAQEPADMGTAFGMEQWLHERDHGVPPFAKAQSGPADRVWLPRWLQRSPLRRSRS